MGVLAAIQRRYDLLRKGLVEHLAVQLDGLPIPGGRVSGDIVLEHMGYPAKKDKAAELFFLEHCLVVLRASTYFITENCLHAFCKRNEMMVGESMFICIFSP